MITINNINMIAIHAYHLFFFCSSCHLTYNHILTAISDVTFLFSFLLSCSVHFIISSDKHQGCVIVYTKLWINIVLEQQPSLISFSDFLLSSIIVMRQVLKIKMMFSVQILPCQILIQHRLNEKLTKFVFEIFICF